MKTNNRIFFFEFAAILWIFLAAIPRRLIFPLNNLFAFNYDQGRDLLAVSRIIDEKDVVLIGSTTGLQGIFYGHWWYYFLAPLVFITDGDPQKIAIFFAFIGVFTIVFLYFLLKKITENIPLALFVSSIAAFSNLSMLGPTSIWNPTLTPIFFIANIYAAHKIFKKPHPFFYFLLGISAFLVADTTGSMSPIILGFFITLPVFFKKYFYKKEFLYALFGALLILLPRILFELKNNFLMTRSTIQYLIDPPIYGERLNIIQ